MNTIKSTLLTIALVFIMTTAMNAQSDKSQSPKAETLRHVVLFKFKSTSSEQDVQRIIKEFGSLPKRIKEIKAFEWGLNNSPENLNEGLTHAFVLSFSSAKERDDYLIHPEHKKFVDIVGPHIEKAVVVDYWAK